ncbi:hypothetical protein KI688_000767 [Linnemannia hyalina]|uniref:Uncharacterized protein n=1 Tax=Linnemannia hyalina TaxID=64524 RepID=A0A9P8BYY8_9FUNG|nr:hypothetical protein KI688_000767 [Linnemannia hyalina]
MSADPLAIPEILTRVGYFLPLWVPRSEHIPVFIPFLDKPRTFLNYMLVSKLWYQVMVPILWRTCLHARLTAVPAATLERFLPHIRFLEAYASAPLVIIQCTRLIELTIAMDLLFGSSVVQTVNVYRGFVRANPGLRALSWDGMVYKAKSTLDPEDFTRLSRLESLTLLRWCGFAGDLARILKPVAGSLTTLKLHHLVGVSGADLIAMDQYGSSEGIDRGSNNSSSKLGVGVHGLKLPTTSLCFPVLTSLSFEMSGGIRLDLLIRCCPNLESLDFYISEETDIDPIAQMIRSSCPKLRSLNARSEMSPVRGLSLMRDYPSTPGLQHLRLSLGRYRCEIGLEILSLFNTLKSLDLSIRFCEGSTADLVLGLLRTCEGLELLEVAIQTYMGRDILLDLAKHPWMCQGKASRYHGFERDVEHHASDGLVAGTGTLPGPGVPKMTATKTNRLFTLTAAAFLADCSECFFYQCRPGSGP